MAQTPYELLLKKQRERRNKLVNTIESKDLNKRSISYNLKVSNEVDQDPEGHKPKDKIKINFAHSLKKAYLCRKFLNRTAEGTFTSDDFKGFKDKIAKGLIKDAFAEKQISLKDHFNKENHSKELAKDCKLQIVTCSKDGSEEQRTQPLCLTLKKSAEQKVDKVQSISQIAQRRKMSLDFDLQIHGNKKNIRVKDVFTSKSPMRKRQKETTQQDLFFSGCKKQSAEKQAKDTQEAQKMKPPCTFFKRFQAQRIPDNVYEANLNMKISKLKQTLGQLADISFDSSWVFGRSNTADYQPSISEFRTVDTPYHARRDIRSSWNHGSEASRRYHKLDIAQAKRNALRKQDQHPSNFTNDIKGWNVKNQNEDEEQLCFSKH